MKKILVLLNTLLTVVIMSCSQPTIDSVYDLPNPIDDSKKQDTPSDDKQNDDVIKWKINDKSGLLGNVDDNLEFDSVEDAKIFISDKLVSVTRFYKQNETFRDVNNKTSYTSNTTIWTTDVVPYKYNYTNKQETQYGKYDYYNVDSNIHLLFKNGSSVDTITKLEFKYELTNTGVSQNINCYITKYTISVKNNEIVIQ